MDIRGDALITLRACVDLFHSLKKEREIIFRRYSKLCMFKAWDSTSNCWSTLCQRVTSLILHIEVSLLNRCKSQNVFCGSGGIFFKFENTTLMMSSWLPSIMLEISNICVF